MGTNTGIGIGIGIPFKNNALGGDRPYLPPELKARLIGVWDNYGKKNTDADRNIIKNKIPNAGGDLEILNSAYRLNSGFGGYSNDFQEYTYSENVVVKDNTNTIFNSRGKLLVPYSYLTKDIPSFKIKVSGLSNTYHFRYYYRDSNGVQHSVDMAKDGNYELPICYNVQSSSDGTDCGFVNYGSNIVSVEILPEYEGAFVTDGVNDMIVSQNPVSEMLGGSNEITVVSMTHKLSLDNNWTNLIGELKGDHTFVANRGINTDKTGIYGYTYNYNENAIVINNILGDKNDYIVETSTSLGLDNKYYVTGFRSAGIIQNISQIAWYWTFIANKVLTTDEINQVIAYYNLDRTLKSDILCNTIKQGITNENHAEFGDKLIDFSGNGRYIQLNNLAWDGNSGIGKYNYPNWKVNVTQGNKYTRIVYYDSINGTYSANFKGITDLYKSYGLSIEIKVNRADTVDFHSIKEDAVYTITPPDDTTSMDIRFGGENVYNASCNITITQIPSHAGGLCLDGINDFGKATGMPVYKDYTFIIDYERISYASSERWVAGVVSKSHVANQGAFILMTADTTVEPGKQAYSFGGVTSFNRDDFTRALVYQSKYKCGDVDLTVGEGVDSNTLWLGTFRDNDQRFFNGAIYSLMSFPYSMSEFLIERQLKKHKLGTLYPNMVEFRPVIKANDNYKIFYTAMLPLTGDIWERINIGDYVPVGRRIAIQMSFDNEVKKLVSAVSSQLGNITIVKNSNNIGYTIFGDVLKDKSPQKISITIEQDENYVLFNPVINSNYEYTSLDFFLNNYQKKINIGDYIPKDAYLRANLYLNNNVDEPAEFTFNGVSIDYSRSITVDKAFNIGHIYNYNYPQEVNITIDEYIRYEDIVQPYPVLLRFNDENGNEVSWGGKFRVGSTITRIGSFYENNLIDGLYIVRNPKLNGNNLNTPTHVVEKSMVFTCDTEYLLDNNEPKCILSPSRLRMPNSSYKILGYIPDISGHGNHGKINNSAYAGMSGVNGYPVVFGANETWKNLSSVAGYTSDVTSTTIHITRIKKAGTGLLFSYVKKDGALTNIREIPAFRVTVKGLEGNSKFGYRYLATEDATIETVVYLGNGTHELSKSFTPTEALLDLTRNPWVGIFITPIVEGELVFDCDITIEVLPEYEGAYCLDGIDDFVIIPTTVGGKQVLMKVNWDSPSPALLYDQRSHDNEFAIYNGLADSNGNPIPAYQGRNNGQTYIDGILNSNIKSSELRAITHNITITNELSAGVNKISPVIGSNKVHNTYFTNMALYDFMLFDNISTDDKIKQLNEYVGIEAKVELPPYYWDAYGKTNLDADRDTIQQRGVAVGDYDITNYNHAYEGMSGYNGYPVVFGANKTWANESDGYVTSITSNTIHITNVLNADLALLYSYVKYNGNLQNIKEIPSFKIEIKGLEGRSEFIYKYLATSDATKETDLYLGNGTHELPKSFLPTEALIDNAVVGFSISPIEEGVTNFLSDITIEVLPEYENGLAYDGVSDSTDNKNIPILTDFTFIIKREILGLETNESMLVIKGDKVYNNGIGNAFILEHNSNGANYVYSYGKLNWIKRDDSKIIYLTPESYNGNPIIKGENGDNLGLVLSRHWRGIIYKTILYSKTISLLQINFLKNLMEKDEIIDLNNPIFIKNE